MVSIDEKTLEFLKANPDEYYLDEKLTKYQFINNELVITKSYFNSKEALISWQNKMINKSDQYPVLEELEHSWSVLTAEYNGQYSDLVSRKIDHRDTPLSAFRNYIDSGFYPPPEVLLALDDCFRMYMALSGQLELEDIFYGERKRGVGNFSARKSRIQAYELMWTLEGFEPFKPTDKKKTSINKLAEGVLERQGLPDDLDTFLRGYRRYKKKVYKVKVSDK